MDGHSSWTTDLLGCCDYKDSLSGFASLPGADWIQTNTFRQVATYGGRFFVRFQYASLVLL
jgi:hypothetical protein